VQIITILFTYSPAEWAFFLETHCDRKTSINRWYFFQKIIILFKWTISILVHYDVISEIRLSFIIIVYNCFLIVINLILLVFCLFVSCVHIIILVVLFYGLILWYIYFFVFFIFIYLIYFLNVRIENEVWRLFYLILINLRFVFKQHFMIFVVNWYLRLLVLIKIRGSHHEKSEFALEFSFRIDKRSWWTLNSILILNFFLYYWFFNFVILFFLLNTGRIIICEFLFEILNIIFQTSSTCWFLMHTDILALIFRLLISPFGPVLTRAF
jgi:hypothetical protein